MSLLIRIAKASMSREISLVNDYDGIAKIELRVEFPIRGYRRKWNPKGSAPITCHCLRSRLSSQKRAAHRVKVLQRTFKAGPSWLLYCTLKSLPFVAGHERW